MSEECSAELQGKNLHEASNVSGEKAPYSCGMVLKLSIDAAVRGAGTADGLFAVWRNYIPRTHEALLVIEHTHARWNLPPGTFLGADLKEAAPDGDATPPRAYHSQP